MNQQKLMYLVHNMNLIHQHLLTDTSLIKRIRESTKVEKSIEFNKGTNVVGLYFHNLFIV